MIHNTKKGLFRSNGRRMTMILLIAAIVIVLALLSACSASGGADDSELRITDSGLIVKDENWFTYYVVVENLTDKPLKDLTVKMTGYDENGEEIHMKNFEGESTMIQMHEGEVNIGYIAPGGKGIYANDVNINADYAEFEAIPSRIEFSINSPAWAKEEGESLEVVDLTEYDSFYGSDMYYWDPESGDIVFEGIETREDISITIKNTGDQDYVMREDHGFNVSVVLRDDSGYIVGVSSVALGIGDSDLPYELTIPAGEEVCFDGSSISYVPYESVECFISYYEWEA